MDTADFIGYISKPEHIQEMLRLSGEAKGRLRSHVEQLFMKKHVPKIADLLPAFRDYAVLIFDSIAPRYIAEAADLEQCSTNLEVILITWVVLQVTGALAPGITITGTWDEVLRHGLNVRDKCITGWSSLSKQTTFDNQIEDYYFDVDLVSIFTAYLEDRLSFWRAQCLAEFDSRLAEMDVHEPSSQQRTGMIPGGAAPADNAAEWLEGRATVTAPSATEPSIPEVAGVPGPEPRQDQNYSTPFEAALAIPETTLPQDLITVKRRGRRGDQGRRDAIRSAIRKYGQTWRGHLSEIFEELDTEKVPLGDFQQMTIDLGDGQKTKASKWGDLDLAEKDQRKQIVDALRKYAD